MSNLKTNNYESNETNKDADEEGRRESRQIAQGKKGKKLTKKVSD